MNSLFVIAIFIKERDKDCHDRRKVQSKVVGRAYVLKFIRQNKHCMDSLSETVVCIIGRDKDCHNVIKIDSKVVSVIYVTLKPTGKKNTRRTICPWQQSSTQKDTDCHYGRKVDSKMVDWAYVIPRSIRREKHCMNSLSVTAIYHRKTQKMSLRKKSRF